MNFQEEVRAHRDLDSFLAQASILLDEKAATPVKVLRRMVAHVAEDGHRSCDVDEVMTSLFTDAGGKEFSGEAGNAGWSSGVKTSRLKLIRLFFCRHSSASLRDHSGRDSNFNRSSLRAVLALYSVSYSGFVKL